MRRVFIAIAATALLAGFWASSGTGTALAQNAERPTDTIAEADFVESLNATRTAAGLEPLRVDPDLTAAARAWATSMSDRSTLEHAQDIVTGAPSDWTKAGENVGRGGSVPSIWQAFMDSPSHAANVLDSAYSRIGIGVVLSDDGILYTAHRFAGASSDLDSVRIQTPAIAPLPAPAGPVGPPPAPDRVSPFGGPPVILGLDPNGDRPPHFVPALPLDRLRLQITMQLLLDAG